MELSDGTTAEQATAYLQQHNPHRATFTAVCDALGCEPGELISVEKLK